MEKLIGLHWRLHSQYCIDDNFGFEILVPDLDSLAGDGALSKLSLLRHQYLELYSAHSYLFKIKKFVQIGHVWTVSDNNFLLFFENGSHFWTAITLQLVDGF